MALLNRPGGSGTETTATAPQPRVKQIPPASPNMFRLQTVIVRARPGQRARCGAISMNLRPSWLSRPPQSGIPGGRPNPRKPRAAKVRITSPIRMLNEMIMIGIRLGTTCRRNGLNLELPIASAASKYTFSLMPMTALRITLLPAMPPDIPRTSIICGKPLPTMDITVNNRSSPGKLIQVSTNLCTPRSNLPPKNPEMPPIRVLSTTLRVVTVRPISTEIRAPKIMRLKKSRPTWSVPRRYLADEP